MKTISSIIACIACAVTAHAAEVRWNGSANAVWDNGANWSTSAKPTAGADVVIGTATGLTSGYGMTYETSQTIESLTIDVARFSLISSATRTLTIGNPSSVGKLTLTDKFTTSSDIFTAGTSPIFKIEFHKELTLANNGTGEARFNRATLQNNASSTGPVNVFFEGSGNWAFQAPSSLAKQGAGSEFNVELKGGAGGFSGVLRYAASAAMQVDNLRVNGGSYSIENSTIIASQGVAVGTGGSFRGNGTVVGNMTLDGHLGAGTSATAGTLTVNGDLTLGATAQTRLRLAAAGGVGSDKISIENHGLVYGGELLLELNTLLFSEDREWSLFEGFNSKSGDFSTVRVSSGSTIIDLARVGDLWSGDDAGSLSFLFNQADGSFSVTVVPEPSVYAFLAAGAVGLIAYGRRQRGVRLVW